MKTKTPRRLLNTPNDQTLPSTTSDDVKAIVEAVDRLTKAVYEVGVAIMIHAAGP